MGFSCGIYWAYKKDDSTTFDQIESVQLYNRYFKSKWAQQYFNSAEEYVQSQGCEIPKASLLNFYVPNLVFVDDLGNDSVIHEVGTWYSPGTYLHDWMKKHIEGQSNCNNYAYICELSQKDVIALLADTWRDCKKMIGESVSYIEKAWVYKEEEGYDEPVMVCYPCDGIDCSTDDGKIIRVENLREWGCGLLIPQSGTMVDEEELFLYYSIIETCLDMLNTIDWRVMKVFYHGGW